MPQKRILVTGGTGFLGRHLVDALTSAGYEVRVFTRSRPRAVSRLAPAVEIVEGDISRSDHCQEAMKGCNLVFHLAAAYREPGIPHQRYHDVHVVGTQNLLDAAENVGVERFVHCSTVGVLSHIDNPPADETWPHKPGDIYQSTKSQAELLALSRHCEALPVTVARPTPIYGPGDERLLKLFRLIAHRRFVMLGSGDVFYHMVHVHDAVRGLMVLAEHPKAPGRVFTIGGPEYCTLKELTRMIAGELQVSAPFLRFPVRPVQLLSSLVEKVCVPLQVKPPIYRRRVDFFTKSRAFSIERARSELGFEPRVALVEGIRSTVHWYRSNGFLRKTWLPATLRLQSAVAAAITYAGDMANYVLIAA